MNPREVNFKIFVTRDCYVPDCWIRGSLNPSLLNPRIIELKIVESKDYWIKDCWTKGLLNPRLLNSRYLTQGLLNPRIVRVDVIKKEISKECCMWALLNPSLLNPRSLNPRFCWIQGCWIHASQQVSYLLHVGVCILRWSIQDCWRI